MTESTMIRTGPIRYATAERFTRSRPVPDPDTRPSSGEICPQLPSRLDAVMGPPLDRHPQGEDCLNLSITTPARDAGARPVLVWLHGGGFSSGAGLMDWYDGGALAAQGDVVVVSVNYRLGALGYLCLDGISEGNLGLYDQWEALRWVSTHIDAYGGDPGNVTVMGQSAGGLSIRLLLDMPEAKGLFRRAILQSAPLALATRPRDDAQVLGRLFADFVATDPRTADVRAILTAQRETALANLSRSGSTMEPAFTPVEAAHTSAEPFDSFEENVRGLDILYGWNLDDMTAFPGEGDDTADLTRRAYEEPLSLFGARAARAGAQVHRYRLDWRPAASPFGATHCLELPLLFGSREAWRASPMLGNVPWQDVDTLGSKLRTAWITFVRTGTPGRTSAPLRCVPVPG
ncbi:carboxylesterase family protein [Streptomyces durmitorensis]|uniref:Carboxylesterase family protein n=1 Tax=Streptomyces durmitorensis TaxID=319947 RepID=A0ABY4PKI9_9ACTN|nr:carboxylesterase family protein [Streptomyces durmitorensis]UQT54211.1 carboxylesterase family protein [Streptomyces durmitorensis]